MRYAPGEAAGCARALIDHRAPAPASVDPEALAAARRACRCRSSGRGCRSALPCRGRRVGGRGGAGPGPCPAQRPVPPRAPPGQRERCPRHGTRPRPAPRTGRLWTVVATGSPARGARCRTSRGRDAAGILRSAAGDAESGPRVRTLVVLGADPLGRFPRPPVWPTRALDGAEFVVAVASAPGPITERADVVLPAAEAHERPGTTTNIEGRISRLGQKLVAPGQAWPDWMIAAELAVHLGADLGLDSVGAVWDEIERLAPAYRGITRAVLDASDAVRRGDRTACSHAGDHRRRGPGPTARSDRVSRRRVGRTPGRCRRGQAWPSHRRRGWATSSRRQSTGRAVGPSVTADCSGRPGRSRPSSGRRLCSPSGCLAFPLRPRRRGERGPGSRRSGRALATAGQPTRPRRSRGGLGWIGPAAHPVGVDADHRRPRPVPSRARWSPPTSTDRCRFPVPRRVREKEMICRRSPT